MAEIMLKVAEVAERLNATPPTVRRSLERGELRGIKIGRSWRVPESILNAFIMEQLSKAGKPENAAENGGE